MSSGALYGRRDCAGRWIHHALVLLVGKILSLFSVLAVNPVAVPVVEPRLRALIVFFSGAFSDLLAADVAASVRAVPLPPKARAAYVECSIADFAFDLVDIPDVTSASANIEIIL